MKTRATESNAPNTNQGSHRRAKYQKVLDGRKQPIRGLWKRGDRYYAQLSFENPNGTKTVRRVALVDKDTKEAVTTSAEAVKAIGRLKQSREDNDLPMLGRRPTFSEFAVTYFEHLEAASDTKRPETVRKERHVTRGWEAHLGGVRVDRITKPMITDYIAKRQAAGTKARTVNLDVIILRNVLNKAIDAGHMKSLPTENLRPLRGATVTRSLFTPQDIDRLCAVPFAAAYVEGRLAKAGEKGRPMRNARQFADYITLLRYCGSREKETLRLRWADVSFDQKQLTVGADALAKNHEARVVDFNSELERHLQDMFKRRAQDSQWLFPSPQRGDHDAHAKTFRESLRLARAKAELPKFGFHDCRHYFISYAVMSLIDYMTIAKWVGHKDGGVLIGKVYGHLADSHRKAMAQKIVFSPQIVKSETEVAQ
jgi:integrase